MRTQATVSTPEGKTLPLSKGAPQVIAALAKLDEAGETKVRQVVEDLATRAIAPWVSRAPRTTAASSGCSASC